MSIEFEDYSIKVLDALEEASISFLEEAGGEIESSAKRNTKVVTGKTKNSFSHVVDESNLSVSIGSNNENAIWEEFGTGIYAVNGDGRKSKWKYQSPDGKWHVTEGKKPRRMLQKAFETNKSKIQKWCEEKLKRLG